MLAAVNAAIGHFSSECRRSRGAGTRRGARQLEARQAPPCSNACSPAPLSSPFLSAADSFRRLVQLRTSGRYLDRQAAGLQQRGGAEAKSLRAAEEAAARRADIQRQLMADSGGCHPSVGAERQSGRAGVAGHGQQGSCDERPRLRAPGAWLEAVRRPEPKAAWPERLCPLPPSPALPRSQAGSAGEADAGRQGGRRARAVCQGGAAGAHPGRNQPAAVTWGTEEAAKYPSAFKALIPPGGHHPPLSRPSGLEMPAATWPAAAAAAPLRAWSRLHPWPDPPLQPIGWRTGRQVVWRSGRRGRRTYCRC